MVRKVSEEVELAWLGQGQLGSVMSTQRFEEWVGSSSAERRIKHLQEEEGHVPRPRGKKEFDAQSELGAAR